MQKQIEYINPIGSLIGFYQEQINKLQHQIENCEKQTELQSLEGELVLLSQFDNSYVVDTAGFEPIEVKFKKFEQNGIIAQLHSSDFDSSSLREMYLSENMQIYPDDDIEDIYAKLSKQREFANRVHNENQKLRTLSAKDEEQSDENLSGESTKSDVPTEE